MKQPALHIVLFLQLSLCAFSQSGGETPLTLEDAATLMLQNHPELEALRIEEEVADYGYRATAGLRLPSLGLTALYAYFPNDIVADLNGLKPQVRLQEPWVLSFLRCPLRWPKP